MERQLPTSSYQLLSVSPHFRALSPLARMLLSRHAQVTPVASGTYLFQKQPKDKDVFLICSGKVKLIQYHPGKQTAFFELNAGDLIGDIAHLADHWCEHSAIAIRDCLLLKIPHKAFDRLMTSHPDLFKKITKGALEKALPRHQTPRLNRNFCIAPAGNSAQPRTFIRELLKHFSNKKIIHLNESVLREQFKTTKYLDWHQDPTRLCQWLNVLENEFDIVIYEATHQLDEWSKQCFRQADEVLLVNNLADNSDLNPFEQYILRHERPKHLVHLHYNHQTLPTGTQQWLQNRQAVSSHHICLGQVSSFQRLIRYLMHESQALVLGGGGARGLCHIGIYRAMQECGMSVDCVGGTSAGAIMSALIAMDYDHQAIYDIIYEHIVCNKRLFSFTLPIHSLRSGKYLSLTLQHIFGENRHVEDLWLRFFCVSTSLTHMRTKMLNSGVLWRTLRASISLPGIYPPITTPDKELLIDGAVTNNLPVELMREFAQSDQITAAKVSGLPKFSSHAAPNGHISIWNALLDQFKHRSMPTFFRVIMESVMLSGNRELKQMPHPPLRFIECDTLRFDPLNFKPCQALVELGYRTAMETFEKEDKRITNTQRSAVIAE